MSAPIIKFRVKFLDDATFSEFVLLQSLNSISALDVMTVSIQDSSAQVQIKDPSQLTPFFTPVNQVKLTNAHLAIEEDSASRSLRSVYVPRVPLWVASAPSEYLISLINEANDNLNVTELYFLGSATKPNAPKHNLKVTFENSAMRESALTQGFKIGHLNISTSQIMPDSFIEVIQCYKCLQFGHTVRSCTSNIQLCSKCADTHSHKLCNSRIIKCYNCGENHTAVHATCPRRKRYVHDLRNQTQSQSQPQQPLFQPAPLPATNVWETSPPLPTAPVSSSSVPPPPPPPPPSSSRPSPSLLSSPPPPVSPPTPSLAATVTPNPASSSSSADSHLDFQYQAFDTFAKMAAGSNSVKYLKLMNEFFHQQGMTSINITQNIEYR